MTYEPKPVDTSAIPVSPELNVLVERLAQNAHDVWAAQRRTEGWQYGPNRSDVEKTTPCMVPYEELPEAEKKYDREMAVQSIKLVQANHFRVVPEAILEGEILNRFMLSLLPAFAVLIIAMLAGMQYLFLFPVAVILPFIYYADKVKKEPLKLLVLAFFLGALSCLPVGFVEGVYQETAGTGTTWLGTFFEAFTGVALVEEGAKWLVLYWFFWRRKEFDEKFDGIVYAVCISMGFACLENLRYVLGESNIWLGRTCTAVPAHACFAIVMGYFFTRAKFEPVQKRKFLLLALLAATAIHGIYDFLLLGVDGRGFYKGHPLELIFLFAAFNIVLWVWCYKTLRRLSMESLMEASSMLPAQDVGTPMNRWLYRGIVAAAVLATIGILLLDYQNTQKKNTPEYQQFAAQTARAQDDAQLKESVLAIHSQLLAAGKLAVDTDDMGKADELVTAAIAMKVSDTPPAEAWYRQSAEKGDASAQFKLGLCYALGLGVAKDEAKAFAWFSKAAGQGHARALYIVGLCYNDGTGIAKDAAHAVECLKLAATAGDEDAKKWLKEHGL